MAAEPSHSNTPLGGGGGTSSRLNPSQSQSQSQSSLKLISKIPKILPHERVFPIQIGSELFKLSGASISSDAPSYFSQYFLCQLEQAKENNNNTTTATASGDHHHDAPPSAIRTLYIDRDPVTFRDISLHLQGYHVTPRDGTHFVRLFADAQFYSLPKLISQLYEESIFMSIGHREFQIPRDLFADPGNSPNFFSLGFAIFFSNPADLFPGLDREGLIRPPSLLPPSVPGRSAETFAEILHLLRGYPLRIRDEQHRASLLRDCRYFNFKGLEQRLVPHRRAFNQLRGRDEIALRLQDILKSGISLGAAPATTDQDDDGGGGACWVHYARPYVDDHPAELVLEIGDENTRLHFDATTTTPPPPPQPTPSTSVEFLRDARPRFAKLVQVVAAKLNLPPPLIPPADTTTRIKCVLEPGTTAITLDGERYVAPSSSSSPTDGPSDPGLAAPPPPKRRRTDGAGHARCSSSSWVVRTGQWRLRIQTAGGGGGGGGVECVLYAVKLDAVSGERARNEAREFLS